MSEALGKGAAGAAAPIHARLRSVPFARRYLAGQSLSILGDTSLWLAMGIWVREMTGSNADAGLTFFFMAAPSIFGPAWGTMVDRFRRRPVLIWANVAGALLTVALLAVHNRHGVWIVWTVMAGYGVIGSTLGAAQTGFLRTLLPDELLGEAQGLLSTIRQGLRLVSPLIGAGLFTLVGAHAVALVDSATFVVAAVSVATIRTGEPAPVRAHGERFMTEMAAGWAHIRDTVVLRQVVLALTVVCAVVGFTETGIVAAVTTGLHLPATWLGPFEALMGVGALLGGPTVARAMRRWGEVRVCAIGIIAFAVGDGVMVIRHMAVVGAGAALAGFGLPWLIASAMTLLQRETPARLQGRVSATADVLLGTPQSISIAVGAGLVAVVGFQVLMGAVAVVSVAAGVWLLTRRQQRRAPSDTTAMNGMATAAGGTFEA